MPSTNKAISDLQRLVDAARESYHGHRSTDALASFVHGLVLPPLQELLNDTVLSLHHLDPYPEKFIHYTSLSSIVSMFEEDKGKIRLYDANQSNDPTEGMYLSSTLRFPNEYSWVHDTRPSSTATPSFAYIASFIVTGDVDSPHDDLIYWRTYGREGAGCSLELVDPPPGLKRVRYGDEAVAETLEALLPVVTMLDPLAKVDGAVGRIVSTALWEALDAIRYLYKDEPYRYESECRYIIRGDDVDAKEISFDARGSSIFPSRVRHYCRSDPGARIRIDQAIEVIGRINHIGSINEPCRAKR